MYIYYSCIELDGLDRDCGLGSLRIEAIGIEITGSEWDWENSAEVIAKDHYDDHAGWENAWPLHFRIWDEEGVWVGDYVVEIDYEPTFNATEVTEVTE